MATNSEFEGTDCQRYEALLEDFLGGELSAADAKSAMGHWHACAACRAQLEDASASVRLLQLAEPSPDPGPGFAHMVMARIRTAESETAAGKTSFWQPFVSLGWRFAATATVALVVLVSYNIGRGHRAQPDAVSVRPTEGFDLFAPEPARVPANGDEVLMMVADNGHEGH